MPVSTASQLIMRLVCIISVSCRKELKIPHTLRAHLFTTWPDHLSFPSLGPVFGYT